MTNAVVPYEQIERMAVSVANSKLFGVKTKDEAIAIMLLAQSEGIHPMTAVQTYHIINGRPSMKADTMLARFQADGGTVEWSTLNDQKAEAIFRHPQSPKPVTIDWTIERAQKAGLTKKDVWIGYGRAMLRSRVISEGVRTVRPGVIAGIYTPEELVSLDPDSVVPSSQEEAINNFERPALAQSDVDDFLKDITSAPDMSSLKDNFSAAWTAAKKAGDERRMWSLKTAYAARRDELSMDQMPQEQI